MLDKRFADYQKSKVPLNINKVHKTINTADAFIIISAEYNHMPPPALINIFNYFYGLKKAFLCLHIQVVPLQA